MYATSEILYNFNSLLIVSILFLLILVTNEIGYRLGSHFYQLPNNDIKSQTNSIQGGMLGLLALLLGFTFSIALERYNKRSETVIEEANAIGTTLLRTRLLPPPFDSEAATMLHKYIDLRVDAAKIDLSDSEDRYKLGKITDNLQDQIWETAMQAAKKEPNPVTTGLFISTLNDMIDARSTRNAYLQLHVPEVILFLLFVVFITSGGLIGYASGLGKNRNFIPTLLMTFLINLVVFIIIDLDRPRRGLIRVNKDSIKELQEMK